MQSHYPCLRLASHLSNANVTAEHPLQRRVPDHGFLLLFARLDMVSLGCGGPRIPATPLNFAFGAHRMLSVTIGLVLPAWNRPCNHMMPVQLTVLPLDVYGYVGHCR